MTRQFLFMAGSTRKASTNKALAKAASGIGSNLGISAKFIDLLDYEMPIYNGDLEAEHSLPETAIKLKALFSESDGFLIASPEYNSSFSPVLKNTLDWISRSHSENEPPLAAYRGKVAALVSCSPGANGGLRGLVPLRMMLGNIGVTVVPDQLAVGSVMGKLENGVLTDQSTLTALQKVVEAMIHTTTAQSK